MKPLLPFILFVCVFAVVGIFGIFNAKKRRQALGTLAAQLGLKFAAKPGDVHERYERDDCSFQPFGQGRSRRSTNLISGSTGGIDWEIFDYRYTTGSGKS